MARLLIKELLNLEKNTPKCHVLRGTDRETGYPIL
ncbi:MAG: hypothetical protein ACI9XZ_004178 [Alphaproteobacteria bacterium]|jgi:hypothetical protein